MLAVITEVFCDGASRIWCKELQRGCIGCGSSDNDRVFHRPSFFQSFCELRDSRTLLTNSNVNAVQMFLSVSCVEVDLLVEDRVESNCSLTSLAVTNDELTLTSTNRYQSVHGLQPGLHRFVNTHTRHNAWGLDFNTSTSHVLNRTFAVNRITQGIDNSTKHSHTDWNVNNGTSTLACLTFRDLTIITEDHNTHIGSFKIER